MIYNLLRESVKIVWRILLPNIVLYYFLLYLITPYTLSFIGERLTIFNLIAWIGIVMTSTIDYFQAFRRQSESIIFWKKKIFFFESVLFYKSITYKALAFGVLYLVGFLLSYYLKNALDICLVAGVYSLATYKNLYIYRIGEDSRTELINQLNLMPPKTAIEYFAINEKRSIVVSLSASIKELLIMSENNY
ncbi:hypothetical protein [Sunxiuqinia indica]|uniref:hypothetical protein n=1 Tax=Sunxiuqinia indica TaxID=2692584 RepID=UPI00135A74C9|nr:hypothetical protein [Sunxiuqinia indica]